MDLFLAVVGGAVGIGGGIAGGYWAGERVRDKNQAVYWALNAAGLLLGIALSFVGMYVDVFPIAVGGLGFLGGVLTGLKYGYGKSVGVWRAHDRMTGIDED